ncbi:hypothetical protein ACQ4PT_003455 [Festuca glaucescens]
MASPEDMVELETVEETEVLRRLGTGEKAGLTTEEAARRLRVHGPNVVSRSRHEDSGFCEFLMMIFSIWGWHHASPNCKNMFCVMLNSMSWVAYNFKSRSLMGGDEEIRAALFLQMSIVNQAVVLFAHSDDCCIIRCPGPFVAVTSIFTQMVATHKAVYGGLDFALAKGVGWVRAGLVWLCNFVVLMTPIFIYHRWRRANMTSEKLVTVCMHSAVLRLNLLWSLYVILDMRLQQPVPT